MGTSQKKPRIFPAFSDILIILGLLVFVPWAIRRSLPYIYPGSRLPPSRNACINNLHQIDGAKQQWAIEHHAPSNAVPTWPNIQPYLGRGTGGILPKCPDGGIYTIGSLTDAPTCSIKGHVLN